LTSGILAELAPDASAVVIRLRSLGDTVLTTPALALLRQARPDLRVHAVLERPFDQLLEGHPDVNGIVAAGPSGGWAERLSLIRTIRTLRPELCLNLHGGTTSALLTAFSGARWRAGYGHYRSQFVYNVRIPRAQEVLGRAPNAAVHTAEHHAAAVFHLGADGSEAPAARLAAAPERREKPYAVFHVAAAYFTKQWAAEKFAETARFVRDRYRLTPVIVAGRGEIGLEEQFHEFDCCDALSIRELMSLIAGARLFVGNDSGPAHIAAAFGKPCVVVFGSSDSSAWRPWKTPHEVVETEWDCKPCPGDRCYAFDEPRCILSVEVPHVQEAVERLLRGCAEPGAVSASSVE